MAMFFSMQDLEAVLSTVTGLPIAQLFWQVTGTRAGGFGLTFLLMVSGLPSAWNAAFACGRVFWAFARDDAVPFSKYFSHVDSNLTIPVRSQLLCTVAALLLGLLYMWAQTAFNAFIGANLVLFNMTYAVPVGINILRKRKSLIPGWFYMRKWGMVVNIAAFMWILFMIGILEIPYFMPVDAAEMNYTCLIVGAGLLFELFYFIFKRNVYKGPTLDESLNLVLDGQTVAVPVSASVIEKQ